MTASKTRKRFWMIMAVTALAVIVSAPKDFPVKFNLGPIHVDTVISSPELNINLGPFRLIRDLKIKKGLDLQGGTQLVLQAMMEEIPESDRQAALESATAVISRRVNLYGVSEAIIQTARSGNEFRVIVELPGVTDPEEAKGLIGQTAKLEFREPSQSQQVGNEAGRPSPTSPEAPVATDSPQLIAQEIGAMTPTDLTGDDLKLAGVQFDSQSGEPVVSLTFSTEGRDKFAEITKRNVGKRVGIFLDGVPLTIPTVQTPITDGKAIISGGFTTDQAKQLVINLNAGALPVDLKMIAQTRIGATLGEESIGQSVRAGLIGLIAVAVFMIIIYRRLGLIADAALVIYGLITLAVYKLVPITLTLPGVAGFILSVGMATDANILIFERTKEELKRGHKLRTAVELGFGRAWDSIKDANVATLLTAAILYNPFDWDFLNTSGLIRGFALTLTVGIGVGLFTGIVVSRTLIRLFYVSDKRQVTSNKRRG